MESTYINRRQVQWYIPTTQGVITIKSEDLTIKSTERDICIRTLLKLTLGIHADRKPITACINIAKKILGITEPYFIPSIKKIMDRVWVEELRPLCSTRLGLFLTFHRPKVTIDKKNLITAERVTNAAYMSGREGMMTIIDVMNDIREYLEEDTTCRPPPLYRYYSSSSGRWYSKIIHRLPKSNIKYPRELPDWTCNKWIYRETFKLAGEDHLYSVDIRGADIQCVEEVFNIKLPRYDEFLHSDDKEERKIVKTMCLAIMNGASENAMVNKFENFKNTRQLYHRIKVRFTQYHKYTSLIYDTIVNAITNSKPYRIPITDHKFIDIRIKRTEVFTIVSIVYINNNIVTPILHYRNPKIINNSIEYERLTAKTKKTLRKYVVCSHISQSLTQLKVELLLRQMHERSIIQEEVFVIHDEILFRSYFYEGQLKMLLNDITIPHSLSPVILRDSTEEELFKATEFERIAEAERLAAEVPFP